MEVTIEITQYCPWKCDYCSSNAGPQGKHLSKERILNFLSSLKNVTRINISGGEPLSHPNFFEILMKCYDITDNVYVYTNAIKNIIFNSDIIREVNVEANVCVIAGREIYIPKDVSRVHLLKLVHQGRAKNLPKQNITVSGNFCNNEKCKHCNHILLQANGKVVPSPCKKEYT